MKSLNFIFATAIAAAAAVMTSGANALVILTLDNDGNPSYQQTQNNPCVIGGPSCNNPAGFGFTDVNALDNDGTVTLAESTSNYTVAQVIAVAGNSFDIGVDTNQAMQTGINLQTFNILIGGTIQFQYNVAAPGTLVNLINGNGYSDAVLLHVDLTPFIGTPTAQITFQALYNNATDGVESFFLITAAGPPPCIPSPTNFCGPPPQQAPEPGTLFLLGVAILGMAVARKRVLRSGA